MFLLLRTKQEKVLRIIIQEVVTKKMFLVSDWKVFGSPLFKVIVGHLYRFVMGWSRRFRWFSILGLKALFGER